jgi:hypothetical protein
VSRSDGRPRLHLTSEEQRGLAELLDLLPDDQRGARLPEVLERWEAVCISRRRARASSAGLPETHWPHFYRPKAFV